MRRIDRGREGQRREGVILLIRKVGAYLGGEENSRRSGGMDGDGRRVGY